MAYPIGMVGSQREKNRGAAYRVHDRDEPGIDEQKRLRYLVHRAISCIDIPRAVCLPALAVAYNQPPSMQHNSTLVPVSHPDPQTANDTPLGLLRRVFGYSSFRGQQ